MFFLYFVYHIPWCCVLCIYTFLSRFHLLIMNEMMILVHAEDRRIICSSPLSICHFSLFCVNYSCCILLYMGSMFIYISLYILWKPAIKTIIILYIYIWMITMHSCNCFKWLHPMPHPKYQKITVMIYFMFIKSTKSTQGTTCVTS